MKSPGQNFARGYLSFIGKVDTVFEQNVSELGEASSSHGRVDSQEGERAWTTRCAMVWLAATKTRAANSCATWLQAASQWWRRRRCPPARSKELNPPPCPTNHPPPVAPPHRRSPTPPP